MSERLLGTWSEVEDVRREGGGKATNLRILEVAGHRVPPWICIPVSVFDMFLDRCRAPLAPRVPVDDKAFAQHIEDRFLSCALPDGFREVLRGALLSLTLADTDVAVRSSGLGEDSAEHSFAGQFDSFLYQRGERQILDAIRRCWASAYSARNLAYLRAAKLPSATRMGVIVQRMVDPECAGVAFSRNPLRPSDRRTLVVESVWGQGEGLVSGALDADHFEVARDTLTVVDIVVAAKTHAMRRDPAGGTRLDPLDVQRGGTPSLTADQLREVSVLAMRLDAELGAPQDVEWAYAQGTLFCLQTRPITTLPPDALFDERVTGGSPVIWDNSNIIESFAGVTTPLTFSHVNRCYREVYYQFCRVMGVPERVIDANEPMFRNMLGLIRGRIYYNLINWYRLLSLFPGVATSRSFMETMMGVKQSLTPELAQLFDRELQPPRYGLGVRLVLAARTAYRLFHARRYMDDFMARMDRVYRPLETGDLRALSLDEQLALYRRLEQEILQHWTAPIVNDARCMVAFGALKVLTERWVHAPLDAVADSPGSLQNDLLSGEGDFKSTEPTKLLMRIAERVAMSEPAVRARFAAESPAALWQSLQSGFAPDIRAMFDDVLARYGFRCADELKLEEPDLHDDPRFLIVSVQSYLRLSNISAAFMQEREAGIRRAAEVRVRAALSGPREWLYFRVLHWARRAVSDRETLRFERTRSFGVTRRLFRAIGANLVRLNVLATEHDVFYLTVDELFAYIEGRSITTDFREHVALRRKEFDDYRRGPAPPDRFLTRGAVGSSARFAPLLADGELNPPPVDDDPSLMRGTPCSPGVVEAAVRIALRPEDAEGMGGEILVAERTDPGWVPLFPTCAGLIIERGSLLSHSAVVAREFGIPTIVGVSGKPTTRLVSGQRVRMDAGKGEIRLL